MSQQQRPTIPEAAMKRIRDLQREFPDQLTEANLTEEVYTVFNGDTIQKDKYLKDDNERLVRASKIVKNKYMVRAPLDTIQVVVLGVGKESNWEGKRSNDSLIMVEEDDGTPNHTMVPTLRRMIAEGTDCDKLFNLQAGYGYAVQLIKYKNGDYKMDDRAIFENPEFVGNPIELLKQLGVKECTIAEAVNNLPREETTSKGTYIVKTDVRIVHAMIGTHGKDPNGKEWGRFGINDETITRDTIVEKDHVKYQLRKGTQVWSHPMYVVFEDGTEAVFVGLFTAAKGSKTKPKPEPYEISMNAYLVEHEQYGEAA